MSQDLDRVFRFPVQTPRGPGMIAIRLGEFKQCPCGCSLYHQLHRIAWVKPEGVLLAEPIQVIAPVYVCANPGCNREHHPGDPMIEQCVTKSSEKTDPAGNLSEAQLAVLRAGSTLPLSLADAITD